MVGGKNPNKLKLLCCFPLVANNAPHCKQQRQQQAPFCTKLGPAICYSMLTAGVACLNGSHPVSLLLAPPSLSPLASARLVRAQVLGNYLLVAFPQHCPCTSAVFIQLQASLQRNKDRVYVLGQVSIGKGRNK